MIDSSLHMVVYTPIRNLIGICGLFLEMKGAEGETDTRSLCIVFILCASYSPVKRTQVAVPTPGAC